MRAASASAMRHVPHHQRYLGARLDVEAHVVEYQRQALTVAQREVAEADGTALRPVGAWRALRHDGGRLLLDLTCTRRAGKGWGQW